MKETTVNWLDLGMPEFWASPSIIFYLGTKNVLHKKLLTIFGIMILLKILKRKQRYVCLSLFFFFFSLKFCYFLQLVILITCLKKSAVIIFIEDRTLLFSVLKSRGILYNFFQIWKKKNCSMNLEKIWDFFLKCTIASNH